MKLHFHKTSLLISLLLFFSCAQKRVPSGGPVDKTPPRILSIKPDSVNLNTKKISPIFITFNEMLDQSSIYKAFRIMPVNYQFEIEWQSFNEVKLIPVNSDSILRETVLLSIGTELTDLRKNQIPHALNILFTPTDSIPSGVISGRVYASNDIKKLQVWAFSKTDTLYLQPFRYAAPTKDGTYKLSYISQPQNYFPLLVVDGGRKFKIDKTDKVFVPVYNQKNHQFNFWKPLPAKSGLLPELKKFITATKNHLSWQMESSFPVEKFYFTADENQLLPKFIYADPQKKNVFHAWFDSLEYSEMNIRWFIDSLISSSEQALELADNLDEIKLKLSEDNRSKPLSPWDTIRVFSNIPINSSVFNTVKMISKMPAQKEYVSPVEFIFYPDDKWAKGDHLSIDFFFSAMDSTITFEYSVLSKRDLGKIYGTIQLSNLPQFSSVYIIATDVKRNMRYKVLSKTDEFEFSDIREGYYALNAWVDTNSNKKYDTGGLRPFSSPEPFWFSSDTLKVRKRWENHSSVIIF